MTKQLPNPESVEEWLRCPCGGWINVWHESASADNRDDNHGFMAGCNQCSEHTTVFSKSPPEALKRFHEREYLVTPISLKTFAAMCEDVTEGPWRFRSYMHLAVVGPSGHGRDIAQVMTTEHDARFIAESRNLLPTLVKAIQEMTCEKSTIRASVKRMLGYYGIEV